MMLKFDLKSDKREQFIDITGKIRELISGCGIKEGVVYIFIPHTTAAVTINENADPDVNRDILAGLSGLAPEKGEYRHSEGNSDAHIKTSLLGSSVTALSSEGNLVLGVWQVIFFCEFDGPRKRQVWLKITG